MTRPVAPLVSMGLAVLTAALVVVGLPLTLAPGDTDRFFSWTMDVPLTAAFLGACYWTAALFTLLAARERVWARARSVVPGVLLAGTLILVATLIHFDKFAMETVRGWVWVILYAGLPPGVLLLLALQRRQPGSSPPVLCPIERGASAALAFAAAALLVTGAALYAFPASTAGWWPWPLTELTARMVGAWLAAVAVTLLAVRHEGDWARVTAATIYLASVAGAHLATLARYSGTVEWDALAAWLYVAFDLALLALAVYGIRMRAERAGDGYGEKSTERKPQRSVSQRGTNSSSARSSPVPTISSTTHQDETASAPGTVRASGGSM
jgi:hypothetical protein